MVKEGDMGTGFSIKPCLGELAVDGCAAAETEDEEDCEG